MKPIPRIDPPSPTIGRLRNVRRAFVRLVLPASVVVLTMFCLVLLWFQFQMLPRPDRRRIVELALRVMLVGYAVVLGGSLTGAFALGGATYRAMRRRGDWKRPARLFVLCGATLFSLAAIEAGAAIWLGWEHRMPTLPTRFGADDGRSHIVVLGGSGALGHPYSPNVSIGRVVAWQLDRALPGRQFQADVLAFLGASLTDMHLKLAEIEHRPAAILVYSGHNEFTGRFEEERDVDLDEAPRSPILHGLYQASLRSPLCRMIYEALSRNRIDGPPPLTNHHRLVDAPMFTPSEGADIIRNFRRRLEAIVAYAEQIGAVPILVIEAADESGYEPNRSLLPSTASAADRRWVELQYWDARDFEAEPDPARAEGLYREMVRRQPGFAEGHFRLARLLERSGRWDEALGHYLLARDLDGMPFRCIAPFHDIYREVAARHPSTILVDGPAELRRICPHGIVDEHAMQDGHHASLRGITALSRAILREIRARRAFGWDAGTAPDLDPAGVASHFGVDSGRWVSACDWGRSFYRWVAGFRFESQEHLARARRFEESGRRIASGEAPDSTGFVPLRLDPLPPDGR